MNTVTAVLIAYMVAVFLAASVLVTYLLFLVEASVPIAVVGLFCDVLLLVLVPMLTVWLYLEIRTMLAAMAAKVIEASTLALQGQTWEINAHMDNGLSGKIVTRVRADQERGAAKLKKETAEIARTLAEADRTNREGTAGLVREDAAVVAEAHREQTADIAERLAAAEHREQTDPVAEDEG